MHDQNAFEYGMLAPRGTVEMDFFPSYTAGTGNNVLIMRSGAIGDLLLASPAISAFRRCNPDTKVSLCCFPSHFQIFENTDLFDSLEPYPLSLDKADAFQRIISLENVIELATTTHATDAFALALGLWIPPDYKPVFKLNASEIRTAKERWRGKRPLVGIQLRASVKNRDYPANEWGQVIVGLEKRGWDVLLFGIKGQIPALPPMLQSPNIKDLSQLGLTLREAAAALSQCDAFTGVDSALLHLCHALDIPAIGLFGPIKWQTRTARAPLTTALTGVGDCAGCGWNLHAGRHFPPNQPCTEKQLCVVLASIDPNRIIAKVDSMRPK